jgi:hypothetical protein
MSPIISLASTIPKPAFTIYGPGDVAGLAVGAGWFHAGGGRSVRRKCSLSGAVQGAFVPEQQICPLLFCSLEFDQVARFAPILRACEFGGKIRSYANINRESQTSK